TQVITLLIPSNSRVMLYLSHFTASPTSGKSPGAYLSWPNEQSRFQSCRRRGIPAQGRRKGSPAGVRRWIRFEVLFPCPAISHERRRYSIRRAQQKEQLHPQP